MAVNIHLEAKESTVLHLTEGEVFRLRVLTANEMARLSKLLSLGPNHPVHEGNWGMLADKWNRSYSLHLKAGGKPMAPENLPAWASAKWHKHPCK